jgi:CRISPR-associated protein Csm3
MKLESTKILSGTILLVTGLQIGGSKSSLNIGGLDSPVIKTPQGIPYIPGSSLKGKIRTVLGLKEGGKDGRNDVDTDSPLLQKMFGSPGDKDTKGCELARLIFRDAMLDKDHFKQHFANVEMETDYTEGKWENNIDRLKGKAENPRQIERVPPGACFKFEIVINVFDDDRGLPIENTLKEGIQLLENNYLGGSGTRGYGKVKIEYTIS